MPLTHVSRSTWYILVAIYVSMFAMGVATLLYANHVATENSRKWCHLLVTLDEAYQQTPPQSPAGRRVADDIHHLRTDLHCGGKR
jgi:nitrate reductase assembly molybdenum cofactor insertion protein NarJ